MNTILRIIVWGLAALCMFSCSKSDSENPAVLSTEEYIRYSINGNSNYGFVAPTDKIISGNVLDNPQPPPTTLVYGERIPNVFGQYGNIKFERTGVVKGGTALLTFFYTETTGFYPQTTSSANPIYINISEYGNIGEYIAGNFSALLVGPPPNNNQYNVTCSFRVKRIV